MAYSNPIYASYYFPAVTLSSAAFIGHIPAPAGKKGRIVDMSVAVTTSTTVAATTVQVGQGLDYDKYGEVSVPVVSSGQCFSSDASTLYTDQDNEIPSGAYVGVYCDGGCTAGAGDVSVVIAWY